MKTVMARLGTVAFWLAWPALFVYLRHSERTRLVLLSGDKILVVKGWLSAGKWSLPGGGLHASEDQKLGLARELFEETGLQLESKEFTPLSTIELKDCGITCTRHFYVAQLPEPLPVHRQLPEILTATWISYRELQPQTAEKDVLYALGLIANLLQ